MKEELEAVRMAALRVIVANPGIRAGDIHAHTIVHWVLPTGSERAMRAVDRALQALRRAKLITYRRFPHRSGWHATKKGVGSL